MAQRIARLIPVQKAAGSIPVGCTILKITYFRVGFIMGKWQVRRYREEMNVKKLCDVNS